MSEKLTIWVLTERGLTGTENQCLGIAEALNGNITVKRIGLKWPYRLWSPFLRCGEGPNMFAVESDPVSPPFPDIVIAGGRKAIGPSRYIRHASLGRTFVCIVQDPKVNLTDFDLIAAPAHDDVIGPDVFVTNGAPNRITPALLTAAHDKWASTLSPLPSPRIAVLIGGNSKTHRLGTHQMDGIITRLKQVQMAQNAGLMITISRRTPKDLAEKLIKAFPPPHVVYTGSGDNPYHGFLAYADYIICTNDSTSMISDTATTGKPIEIIELPGHSKRHDRFMAMLRSLGVTNNNGGYTPWNDARRVADRIKDLLEKRKLT